MTAFNHHLSTQRATVVVGVSPTSGSPQALQQAALEADHRGADLVAVRAWRPPRPPSAPGGRPPVVSYDAAAQLKQADAELTAHVARAIGSARNVSCRVVKGSPLAVLLRESAAADLLIVDAPPRAHFSQTPMLAQRLVYRATCPVLIMPPTVTRGGTA